MVLLYIDGIYIIMSKLNSKGGKQMVLRTLSKGIALALDVVMLARPVINTTFALEGDNTR